MNKGQYYKLKTKKWFEGKGYLCEYTEKLQRIITKEGKVIFVKKDIWGSDGMAMNGEEMIFWNSKYRKANVAKGLKEFSKYPFPSFVNLWLVIWEKGKREPEIIEVKKE